jgi:hypothetical protein
VPVRPEVLAVVLPYYERDIMMCPPDVDVAEVVDACDYLLLPATTESIQCRNMGAVPRSWPRAQPHP